MRVVIDTNVLFSAAWRNRRPERALLWIVLQPDWQWLVTAELVAEYLDVLQRPKLGLPLAAIEHWRLLFEKSTTTVRPVAEITFARDPKDAKVIACALAGEADLIGLSRA